MSVLVAPARPGAARARRTPSRSGPEGRHGLLASLAIGVVLAAITWPSVGLAPQTGIDQSWNAGLAMAIHQHLAFGPRVQFAYGPLGVLVSPALWYPGLAAAAAVYLALLRLAVCSTLVWSLSRSLPWWLAALLGWVASVAVFLVTTPEPILGLVVVWCLALARGDVGQRWETPLVVALGAVAGVGLLIKLTVGLAALALAVVAVLAGSSAPGPAPSRWAWRRGLAALGTTFVAAVVAGWLATGNHLVDLPTWLWGSVQVSTGYSSAMGTDVAALSGDYWRAPLVAAIVAALVAVEVHRLGARRGLGVGVLALVLLGAVWKEGFVRHNNHSLVYFGVAVMAVAGLRATGRGARALLVGGLVVASLAAFDTAGFVPRTNLGPVSGVEALAHQATVLTSSQRSAQVQAQGRAAMQAGSGLGPATLALVRGRTTWVDPWEEALVWAEPGLRWDPPPMFQTYGAYTPWLDQADARFLGSSVAPQRILRQPGLALDGRDPLFESPAAQLSILCHYRAIGESPGWQVLARVANRCGAMRSLGTARASWGQTVPVPAAPPGEVVVASWDLPPQPWSARLAGLALRPAPVEVTVDGGRATYRFLPGTAGDPHLLAVPAGVPAPGTAAGRPSAPLPPGTSAIRSLRLTGGDRDAGASGVTVSFWAVPVRA